MTRPGRDYTRPPPRHPNVKERRITGHDLRALSVLRLEAARARVVVDLGDCPPHIALGALRRARWTCWRCRHAPGGLHFQRDDRDLPAVVCGTCEPLHAVERTSPCPECAGTLRLRRDRHGALVYRCTWGKCEVSQASALDGTPTGEIALAPLRALRARLRSAVEELARVTHRTRAEVYDALARRMTSDPDTFRLGDLGTDSTREALAELDDLGLGMLLPRP